ncbi:hypothetical protein [Campylobacter canadensis]|uniref:Uncharacterized protein n=1 Tax=Campylobacter canadensis TaxID=449520 RepID=A0ABS7WSD4_9BACT|nr:hypothetical protein [Campylobacter canadensis]MBZ7987675.1 hypothetical protein [Campylobacter canadensis]MBZ7995002.1 hypothetical protein [Campylobacter canadensis]MBZ7996944.1 hypothetical protein [Campylobacter canadensis]MBZ7998788.1 hypothetical protein [Campylobacter canadensis]MBZ8000423.1 hypothetical protein [Campylobacter canadensis]
MLNSFAPPFKLVGIYFVFALMHLLTFSFLLFKFNLDSAYFKAFLHSFFAAFALNVIIASLYQLSSVAYEKAFISIKMSLIFALIFNIFICVLLYGFYSANYSLCFKSAIFICIALFYFIFLFLLSFYKIKNLTQMLLYCAVVYLFLGLCAAFCIFAFYNLYIEIEYEIFLYYHIYFMLGFVFFTSMGAALMLLPMFSLNHKSPIILVKISFILYFLAIFHLAIFAYLAMIVFAIWVLILLKNRVRKKLDYWNINVIFSALCLIFTSILCFLKYYNLAILSLIFGVLLPFIVAHMYKILPFLIWYHFIAKFVGKCKVPLLTDMVKEKLANICILLNVFCFISVLFFKDFLAYFWLIFLLLLFINMINIFTFIKYKGEKND